MVAGMNSGPLKVAMTAIALSVFIALGVWQLQRAQDKQVMHDRLLARARMPAVELDAVSVVTDDLLFRTATASGRYLPEYQIFLDNKVYRGRAGYHVLTPLRIRGADSLMLVNRGWAPWGLDRQRIPEAVPPTGDVTVGGRLSRPVRAPISFAGGEDQDGFGTVWQNFDADRYQNLVGVPLMRLVMELESGADPVLVREWPLWQDKWIQRHRFYALQWFGAAIALIVVFLVSRMRRRP
jgi:surfeit locus 1 family protein